MVTLHWTRWWPEVNNRNIPFTCWWLDFEIISQKCFFLTACSKITLTVPLHKTRLLLELKIEKKCRASPFNLVAQFQNTLADCFSHGPVPKFQQWFHSFYYIITQVSDLGLLWTSYLSYYFMWLGPDIVVFVAFHSEFSWWFSFAPIFQLC